MPRLLVTTYQAKGKGHIAYLSKIAERIWAENDFKIPWAVCLQEAFRKHRQYLLKGMSIVSDMEKKPLKSGSGSWWRNKDGEWVELEK